MNKNIIKFNCLYKLKKLPPSILLKQWLLAVALEEGVSSYSVVYNFVDNQQILLLNQKYLQHDYFTDIITFDYSQNNDLQGEIYISIDTVVDNAQRFKVIFNDELLRVMVHGFLHLCGYKDKTSKQQAIMKSKENYYLSKWQG